MRQGKNKSAQDVPVSFYFWVGSDSINPTNQIKYAEIALFTQNEGGNILFSLSRRSPLSKR